MRWKTRCALPTLVAAGLQACGQGLRRRRIRLWRKSPAATSRCGQRRSWGRRRATQGGVYWRPDRAEVPVLHRDDEQERVSRKESAMKLSDQRIITFLSKSPIKSFSAMLDTLRYLDGQWIWEDLEYELFNVALGDNPEEKVHVRVPAVRGITASALFAFAWHAKASHLIRRRPRKMRSSQPDEPQEIIVLYELTPAGKEMIKVLEAIQTTRNAL